MDYSLLKKQTESLADGSPWMITLLANVSALIMQEMDRINWAGFYLIREGELVLGPFQGKPACERIPIGRGVCGTAVAEDKIQRVEDVHMFAGHIACDSSSESEIVLPLHDRDKVIGVLDIDSPEKGRFSEDDEQGLKQIVDVLEKTCQAWTET